MNREILEKPFDQNQIKQREGNFGRTLDYVEGHSIIQRLNDAFDADVVLYDPQTRDPHRNRRGDRGGPTQR